MKESKAKHIIDLRVPLHIEKSALTDQTVFDEVLNSTTTSIFTKRLFVLRNSHVGGLHSFLNSNTIFDEQDRTFYLECINLYREVIQAVCHRLAGVSFPATPACVTIVGSIYAERFLRCLRPSLDIMTQFRSADNIIFHSLHIFCDQEALDVLSREWSLDYLRKVEYFFYLLPETLTSYAKSRKLDSYSWTMQMTYLINASHYGFLEGCRNARLPAWICWPDLLYPTNWQEQIVDSLSSSDVIFAAPYRIDESFFMREILPLSLTKGFDGFSSFDLASFIHSSISDGHLANTGNIICNPLKFVWKTSNLIASICLNLTPLIFNLSNHVKVIEPSLDPIDGNFLANHRSLMRFKKLTGCFLDVSDTKVFLAPHYSQRFSVKHVRASLVAEINPLTTFSLRSVNLDPIFPSVNLDEFSAVYSDQLLRLVELILRAPDDR